MRLFATRKQMGAVARHAVAVGAMFLFAGCKEKPVAKTYLAKVGPSEISTNDFAREVARRANMNQLVFNNETLLNEMISRETLVLKAKEAGLDKDPEVIRAFEGILIARLKERQLEPKVKGAEITEEEVKARYLSDIRNYSRAAKVHLALLHIPVSTNDTSAVEAGQARLTEARKLALALPASTFGFGKLAVDFSEDQSTRYKGGDAGWYDEGQPRYRWPNEVIAAGILLPTNGVSEVIATARGLFLVKKVDARPAEVTPLASVAGSIRHKLTVEKQQRIEQEFGRGAQSGYAININTQILSTLPKISNMAQRGEQTPPALPR